MYRIPCRGTLITMEMGTVRWLVVLVQQGHLVVSLILRLGPLLRQSISYMRMPLEIVC